MKKLVVVTGASKGIGLALTQQFLGQGHRVIGTSRTGIINDFNSDDFNCFKLDLSNSDSIAEFCKRLTEEGINIDLLINNAGIGPDLNMDYPDADLMKETFQVNVFGLIELTESLIELISEKGKILNVSSKMGSVELCVNYDSVAYRMSKTALNMYSKILSNRLENKVDVAVIHPGWVQTSISKTNVMARLTPSESASNIIDFIERRFQNGDYWDAERGESLKW